MRGVVAASVLALSILADCVHQRHIDRLGDAEVLVAHPNFKKYKIVHRHEFTPKLAKTVNSLDRIVRRLEPNIRLAIVDRLRDKGITQKKLRRMDFSYCLLGKNSLILRYLVWLEGHRLFAAVAVFVEFEPKTHKMIRIYLEPLPFE